MLTKFNSNGELEYEVFEASEALAEGDILSLEEKFLAGEGLNITPARFSKNKSSYEKIMEQVKTDLENAAREFAPHEALLRRPGSMTCGPCRPDRAAPG